MGLARLRVSVPVFLAVLAPVPASAQDYYTDVRPVLVRNCVACHGDDGPGWSMADPEEAFQRRHMIAAMVLERQMPPWIAEAGHQEYLDDPTLAGSVLELVREWREGGFPRGEPRPDPGPEQREGGGHHGFRPDLSVEVLPGASYLPNQERADDYRCFVVDWPEGEPGYLTGFRAVPGNLRVSHHTVVHAVSPEMVGRFRELEDAEEGPGYQCFGGALPDRLGVRAERNAYDLESLVRYISRVTRVEEDRIQGVEIHSVNLHMHAFGHSGVISLVDGNGRSQTLLSVPRWDLRWQRDFVLAEPKVFTREEMDGALLRVRCTFRNPTSQTVYGGYGSFDEMCFNFAYIAVRSGVDAGGR